MKNLKIILVLLIALFNARSISAQPSTCVKGCQIVTGGSNKTICCPGNAVSIGTGTCLTGGTDPCGSYTYQWAPSTGLSCSTCCITNASPNTTTTYTLTVTFSGTCCCDGPIGNCAVGSCPSVQKTATVTVTVNSTCCRLINPEQEKEQTNNEINLFPNPTEGKFTLQFNQINAGTCIIIYDANGKMVKADENISTDNKELTYDLSSQAKGIYYIKIIEGENTVYFKKLILQ